MEENEAVELRRLIEGQPRNQTLYIRLGNLFFHHGEYDKAQKEYEKALSNDTGNLNAMKGLAAVYSQKHEHEQALKTLQNMIQIQPRNPDIQYNIACVYAKQGMQEKALLWLRRAVENGFRNIQVIENDPDLAAVRETEEFKRILRLMIR
jgi:Tfp pilus assembly protein PilF